MRRFTKSHKIVWKKAADVRKRIRYLVSSLDLVWVKSARIFCLRSEGAKTRAIARIWGLPRVWQMVLSDKPAYIIEVIGEKYDKLSPMEQDKVLLHEITHIPKNFSGALTPHIRRGKRSFHSKLDILVRKYLNLSKS